MARLALLAQAALVNVVLRVTLHTFQGRFVERQCRMALRATDDAMQTEQRIFGQIVIEDDAGGPGALAVAGFTTARELPAMRVVTAMAARAVLRQRLLRNDRAMAGITVDLRVCPGQREFGLAPVVIGHRLPLLIVMAVIALHTEPSGMRVIGRMATIAVLGNLVLVIPTAMAGHAVDIGVHTQQGIAGFLEMVVLRGLPLLGHVAFAAFRAPRPAVFIVSCVTTNTRLRCLLIAAADVAGIASHCLVCTGQLEVRLLVIELPTCPTQGTVAFAARLCELSAMSVICLVAAYARSGRLAPCLFWLVAGIARQRAVRTLEREVSQVVIEQRAAQVHDIGFAPLVLGMACAALADARIGHAAVIAVVLPYVCRDRFVTIETQGSLSPDVRAVVAVCAGVFLLYVGTSHLARHQQFFH